MYLSILLNNIAALRRGDMLRNLIGFMIGLNLLAKLHFELVHHEDEVFG